jgi:hypothetical protein
MSSFTAPKRRPKRYKARDAAYAVGGNAGFYIASRPRPYPMTPQQKKVKQIAQDCGIKPGITKSDLMTKMVDCVGPKMR